MTNDGWPPASTRQLLTGVEFAEDGAIRLTKDALRARRRHRRGVRAAGVSPAIERRRRTSSKPMPAWPSPLLDEGWPFLEALRVPLLAILNAPHRFSIRPASSSGDRKRTRRGWMISPWRRDSPTSCGGVRPTTPSSTWPARVACPTRRCWRSRSTGCSTTSKRERFVKDFAGQAFRLYEMLVTSPDPELYPEYDDQLAQAIKRETELFLDELIAEDLGVGHLIDADFTFVNRRLAEHYGICRHRGAADAQGDAAG